MQKAHPRNFSFNKSSLSVVSREQGGKDTYRNHRFRMVNMIVYTWSQSMDHGFELCCGIERKPFKTTETTFENAAWL